MVAAIKLEIQILKSDKMLVLAMEEDCHQRFRPSLTMYVSFMRLPFANLMKKFPFKSLLLLWGAKSEERIIVRLAEQFPHQGIGDKLDALRKQALDFQMANLPICSDVDV